MFKHKHPRLRHVTVLTLAVLLASVSVGLITVLHDRAAASRSAELRLSNVNVELNELLTTAFGADPLQGGSPGSARRKLLATQRSIDSSLEYLRRTHPNAQLTGLTPLLQGAYRDLERVRALDAAGDLPKALVAAAAADGRLARATAIIRSANKSYERRALRSLTQATLGSGVVIFILLAGFALFYRRSWVLLAENAKLLSTSRSEALTDVLTGLGNRRALMARLTTAASAAGADAGSRWALVLLDLDGFKSYNDDFGHPAGDALLARLGGRLHETTAGIGTAYRMGGDEFCVLAELVDGDGDAIARLAATALSESGQGFAISSSYGLALLAAEASTPEEALGLADRRMYQQKGSRRAVTDRRLHGARSPATLSAERQVTDALLRVLGERDPELAEHLDDVGQLALQMAQRIGLPEETAEKIRVAGELHDVGKTAIPDSILEKRGPLTAAEWEFMSRHTLIGERIVLAAPALEHTAAIVRSSHERVDGSGYPDGLRGRQIPVGARIISICDAFDAMVTPRPYREAMSTRDAMVELRHGAGTQFDAGLVTVFEKLVDDIEHDLTAARPAAVTPVPRT
jgi:diguanylate cyclase (GGDEF)-like protein